MGRSNFKESYHFLNKHFMLTEGKTNLLMYTPSGREFHEEYYEFFELICEKTVKNKFRLTIKLYETQGKEELTFDTEKQMVLGIKQKLTERKEIGKVKKIFLV